MRPTWTNRQHAVDPNPASEWGKVATCLLTDPPFVYGRYTVLTSGNARRAVVYYKK